MGGELIGVWSEAWVDIWVPLIEQPLDENDEGLAQDIFCELYRELTKVLRKPTGKAAARLIIEDAVSLRQLFGGAARRSTDEELAREAVEMAFDESGAAEVVNAKDRRSRIENALTIFVGKPAEIFVHAELQEFLRDASRVNAANQRVIERTINDWEMSREALQNTRAEHLDGERAVVDFFESVHETLEQFEEPGNDRLTKRYRDLVSRFINKYNLRYDLRSPCTFCPTLSGVFSSLFCELRAITSQNVHLDSLMEDFEESVRDLRIDCSDRRIKTSIQKQVNLLEALGRAHPGMTGKTLGAISQQLKGSPYQNWPHEEVMSALKSLHTFTCDYPGIRHGGTEGSALRPVDMRDMLAIPILLAGFTPYLAHGLNPDVVYRGT